VTHFEICIYTALNRTWSTLFEKRKSNSVEIRYSSTRIEIFFSSKCVKFSISDYFLSSFCVKSVRLGKLLTFFTGQSFAWW
jgi:hypothetical protein